MIIERKDTEKVAALFTGWQETMIWSCLQRVMGTIYSTDEEYPMSAMAQIGDFCFLAGNPDKELLGFWITQKKEYLILVPQNKAWNPVIEDVYREKAKENLRYAIKKEGDIFDREKLQDIVSGLSEKYELKMIDQALYNQCKAELWSKDLVVQYETYDLYEEHGLGVAIIADGELVAGASSYSSYEGGIEVEIDTREDYRRKGLASVCGAKLILECLERGWYPSWDAANLWSVGLAEKLGYHFDKEYTAYEVTFQHQNLTRELKAFLMENGAALVGCADLSEVTSGDFNYGIAIVVPISPKIIGEILEGPTEGYFDEYHEVEEKLEKIALAGERFLVKKGYRAFAQTSKRIREDENWKTEMPHKTVATNAGLGWVGKNCLLVTEEFGSAIRLVSILTDAPLECGEPIRKSRCAGCRKCVEQCPAHALSGIEWNVNTKRDEMLDKIACRDKQVELTRKKIGIESEFLCGRCFAVCPFTQRYVRRNYE